MLSVLITGATDGIGYETARELLLRGWQVLVHGRDETRAQDRTAALQHATGRTSAEPVWGDLSRMQEVAALAAQVRGATPALDVLINNADVYEKQRAITVDGFERTLAVNHFSHYLLTHLLLPALEGARAARVITVSSGTHQSGRIDLRDLTRAADWDAYQAYADSKLANVLFTQVLARRLAGRGITANVLHPGVIGTKLLRAGFGAGGGSLAQGARTSVYLATAPEVADVTGKYFADCRATSPGRSAHDARLAEALWAESARLLAGFLTERQKP